jgi:hypothetical protein
MFGDKLLKMFGIYNRQVGAATPDAWWEALRSYPLEAVLTGIDAACRASPDHPPSAVVVAQHAEEAKQAIIAARIDENRRNARALLPGKGLSRTAALEAFDREIGKTALAVSTRPELCADDAPELERLLMLLCRAYDGVPAGDYEAKSEDIYCRAVAQHAIERKWSPAMAIRVLAEVPDKCLWPPDPWVLDDIRAGRKPGPIWKETGVLGNYRAVMH